MSEKAIMGLGISIIVFNAMLLLVVFIKNFIFT